MRKKTQGSKLSAKQEQIYHSSSEYVPTSSYLRCRKALLDSTQELVEKGLYDRYVPLEREADEEDDQTAEALSKNTQDVEQNPMGGLTKEQVAQSPHDRFLALLEPKTRPSFSIEVEDVEQTDDEALTWNGIEIETERAPRVVWGDVAGAPEWRFRREPEDDYDE